MYTYTVTSISRAALQPRTDRSSCQLLYEKYCPSSAARASFRLCISRLTKVLTVCAYSCQNTRSLRKKVGPWLRRPRCVSGYEYTNYPI